MDKIVQMTKSYPSSLNGNKENNNIIKSITFKIMIQAEVLITSKSEVSFLQIHMEELTNKKDNLVESFTNEYANK